MRCETARTILELNLPQLGEADWRDMDAVENHLKGCPACHTWWSERAREDTLLSKQFRSVPVPKGLSGRLNHKMIRLQSARRRQIACLSGVAVVLLAALGTGYLWQSAPSPLDTHELARLLEWRPELDGPSSHERMEQIADSFRRLGVTVRLPESLDYHQVVGYGVTELQGNRVPQIFFQMDEGASRQLVRLLVLDSRKFDMSQYSLEQNTTTGRQVELVPDSEDDRFYFLLSTQDPKRQPSY